MSVQLPAGTHAAGKCVIARVDAVNAVTEREEQNNTIVFGPIP